MFQRPLYALSWVIVRSFATLLLRFNLRRHGSLPPGPKLFVANHPSATDPFLIHLVSRDTINVMITEKAFNVPVFGTFLRRVGEIPVQLMRGSQALEQAECQLRRGHSVAIFIEGRISPKEGGFRVPRSGAAHLALTTGVPVVPVGIALHRERCAHIRSGITGEQTEARWYLRGPYAVTVGQPARFEGEVENREHVQRVSELIMDKVRLLAYESEQRLKGLELVPNPA
ncbi:MAG: 1-acyl-sn-glycerol-3-phosphate acyltransferase [Anaerolineales bacterium]|nr:1-acyl-sn-glycerol-3-phosphate acyltransferase [Anaerolineales bacterium]